MKISVLQWNVWVQEKADNILKLISEIDADVVCLQELTTNSVVNSNRNIPSEIVLLGYQAFYSATINNADVRMGNGIFSKFPIKNKRKIYVQHEDTVKDGPSNENRIYIEVEVAVNSKSLIIGTVHLSFTPEFIITPKRRLEAGRLVEAAKMNTKHFILTGDMNALPDSYMIKKLDNSLVTAGPNYTESTWTTKHFKFKEFTADGLNWRLDYAYTTPDVRVLSSQIIPTEFSDHLPILVELEV